VGWPPTLVPVYSNGNNPWVSIENSDVVVSGVIIYHTYNYSTWVGVHNSAPLFLIGGSSDVIIEKISFTSSSPSQLLVNPVFVGNGAGSVVKIDNCTFLNVNLKGVSVSFDFWSTTFYFLNVSFRFV
jgi:hypothetical protein